MDFIKYAESAAQLLNAQLTDLDALVDHLSARSWLCDQCGAQDVADLQSFQGELRPVFEASDEGRAKAVIDGLNALMVSHPITPMISDHDPDNLHMHVASRAASVADLLIAEGLLGLANLVCDLGPNRLGVCHAPPCRNVYVDTSPNQSRRYCSDRCSSRANVAAYRARQRAGA